MEYQFSDFDTAHFRAAPRRTSIGPWTVQHMSFAAPGTLDKPPLVFIGGAFQNAWSFLREVRHFMPQRPVILVDLPGQGQNAQLSGGFTFDDFAQLLRDFCDANELRSVVPIGLSYGSGIAYTFARRSPDKVDRLVLGGTTEQIRSRIHEALRRSFWYLEQGQLDHFADSVLHHLLNLPHRATTGLTDRLVTALRAGMLELTENELTRYRDNSTRLFSNRLEGQVQCRTLVFSAAYDHFTTPFESLAVSRRCIDAQFVLIDGADHLAPVEKPKTVIALYDAFLHDRPLSEVPGIRTGDAAIEATRERRQQERRQGRRRDVVLRMPDGHETTAALLDYNAHGCLLEPTNGGLRFSDDAPVRVCVPAIGADGDAVLLPDDRGARAVFLQDAFNTLGMMPVMTVEMPTPSTGSHRVSMAERIAVFTDE